MNKNDNKTFSLVRTINACLAVFLVVFLLVHAALGTVGVAFEWRGELEVVIWVAVGVMGVHILLGICTTYNMFTDTQRPASKRKKQHQILKCISGGIVLAVFICHLCGASLDVTAPTLSGGVLAVMLLGMLAWHSVVGIKSLTRDLGKSSSIRKPIKIAIIVIAVVIGLAMFISVLFATRVV